ncbi:hypothetical protein [Paracidovorax cattleyae]|uniref:hypothetical protein n=1 Tax=Paracidovorax cattleyae TaxID=80868 RepID=UPI00115FE015|nr:hypothetical protein [Paracidovorax cattleyae]
MEVQGGETVAPPETDGTSLRRAAAAMRAKAQRLEYKSKKQKAKRPQTDEDLRADWAVGA